MGRTRLILILLAFVSAPGCTYLFYHPSKQSFVNKEKIDTQPTEVWIPSSGKDGGKLHGWLFKTQSETPAKGVLLFFHGNAQNITSHFMNLFWVLRYDYDYLIFDYRGYGLSEFSNNHTDKKPNPRTTVEDAKDAIQWIENYSQQNKLSYGIYAQSIGGAIAARGVGERIEERGRDSLHAKVIFLDSTFASYREVSRKLLASHAITWPFQWLTFLLVDNSKSTEDYLSLFAPASTIVIHGNADFMVDYSLGRKVYEVASMPKEFWHVEDGMHTDIYFRHEGQFREKLIKKLDSIFSPNAKRNFPDRTWRKEDPVVPDKTIVYQLPVACGIKAKVIQGYDDSFSHYDLEKYAVDFRLIEGTPVVAMRKGEVVAVKDTSFRGGPNSSFLMDGNFIVIRHEDGTLAEYYHLKGGSAQVHLGEKVSTGQQIAESGHTGFSTEPHLHVMVYFLNKNNEKISVPVVYDTLEAPAIRLQDGEEYQGC